MKKKGVLLGIAAILGLTRPAFCQTFELDIKGTGNSTWMLNSNISNAGSEQNPDPGWGYNYGAGLTFYFSKIVGVGADLLINQHAIRYDGTLPLNDTYESYVKLRTTDIPIMVKFLNSTGGFLELGGVYSTVKTASYKFTGSISASSDVKNRFISPYYSVIFGMGTHFHLSKRLAITTGLRVIYSVTDIKGVDGLGRDLSDNLLYPSVYKTYAASHLLAGGLYLGMSYSIGKIKGN